MILQKHLRGADRPSKARRRDQEEPKKKGKKKERERPMKLMRQQPTMRCKKCGMAGHNARSCQCKILSEKERERNEHSKAKTKAKLNGKEQELLLLKEVKVKGLRWPKLGQDNPHIIQFSITISLLKLIVSNHIYLLQSFHNPTLLSPVIRHGEDDDDLESFCQFMDEYQIPRVVNQIMPTPY
ncbi:myb-like transcription factor family protein [Striga asiatica]|uniref:Myb-like transcription factor family protein n=1 Tax=Striga asiatica TaxID=4170 RepID=A0A5A7PDA3_STRAF|nr:myb-like transcription factor family protein [Striga asiatica]